MSPAKKATTAKKTTKPKAKPAAKKPAAKKPVVKKAVKTSKPKMSAEQKKARFTPKIEKVTVNIGVGEAGERLKKAETVITSITGHKPVETLSRTTSKDWSLRKRMPIGCKVTLRGNDADEFLKAALATRENKIADYAFDGEGNLSF
jgi:ribosomal protein L5